MRTRGFGSLIIIVLTAIVAIVSFGGAVYVKKAPNKSPPTKKHRVDLTEKVVFPEAEVTQKKLPDHRDTVPPSQPFRAPTNQLVKRPVTLQLPYPPAVQMHSENTPAKTPVEITADQNLDVQFSAIESELLVGKAQGHYLGPEHSARVSADIDNLLNRGYPKTEIERLRLLLYELSPHLQDQAKQSGGSLSTPSQYSSSTTAPQSCVSNPSPVFTNHITDMSRVNYIGPPPTMGAGPSLKTHSYIGTDHVRVPVYAPVAVTLKDGSYSVGGPYLFDLQVSCEVSVRFGHITEPVDAIRQLLPSEPSQDSRTQPLAPVSFAAGELLGYTTGTDLAGNWDYGVYNSTVRNRYAEDPAWKTSETYTSALCPFDYFPESLRVAYTSKFNSAALGGNPPHGEPFCR